MTVFREAVAANFGKLHADARGPLKRVLRTAAEQSWKNFAELKQSFPNADLGRRTGKVIIDICWNRYRLVAVVNFEEQMFVIDSVLTHKEYDREVL